MVQVETRIPSHRSVPPQFDSLVPGSRIAARSEFPGMVSSPAEFAWTPVGRSAGGRTFQVYSTGNDGFRSLVVGSVGGNDPLALHFTDQLARHLHSNGIILGGFETTVIKTLNPDGESGQSMLNQLGIYINHSFPGGAEEREAAPAQTTAEVRFLLSQIKEFQPQRVLHIRTVKGPRGAIAAGSTAMSAGGEIARWLDFQLIELPGKSVQGSMERYLSASEISQVMTFGIPDTAEKDTLWEFYGDAVLNLLLNEDPVSREIARSQQEPSSADSRGRR